MLNSLSRGSVKASVVPSLSTTVWVSGPSSGGVASGVPGSKAESSAGPLGVGGIGSM